MLTNQDVVWKPAQSRNTGSIKRACATVPHGRNFRRRVLCWTESCWCSPGLRLFRVRSLGFRNLGFHFRALGFGFRRKRPIPRCRGVSQGPGFYIAQAGDVWELFTAVSPCLVQSTTQHPQPGRPTQKLPKPLR